MAEENGSSSWDLSFDDDFDTSSDSLAPPNSLPMVAGKRVVSNASDEGYKSASNSTAWPGDKSSSTNESSSSHQNQDALRQGSPARRTQKQRTLRSMGLGHVTSTTQKASTATPPSRHRQVNSMVYSSSPAPKWQGQPLNTSPSSKRVISPHNSPLMSSFARAREQQERFSEGTLSGLIIRFIRTRTMSTLSLRLALLIIILLLTSLVLTRDSDHTPALSHYAKPAGDLQNDAALTAIRGADGMKHTPQFVGTTHIEEEIGDLPGIELWKQEERRLAHARIAKSFQEARDAQDSEEQVEIENGDSDSDESGLFEDALIVAELAESQNDLVNKDTNHVERSNQEEFPVSNSHLKDADGLDAKSAVSREGNINRDNFELGRNFKDSTDQPEDLVLAEDAYDWRDQDTDDNSIAGTIDDLSKPIQLKQAPAAGRAAILAQVEASRELALLKYQKLQGERDVDNSLSNEDSQSELVKAQDALELSEETPLLQKYAPISAEAEGEELEDLQDGLESSEEMINIEDDKLPIEADHLENGYTSVLDANAAAMPHGYARELPSYETRQPGADDLDNSAQEDAEVPPNLPRRQGGESGRQKRTGLIKQRFKPEMVSQDESTSFEENIAILNARRTAKEINAVGRLGGKQRINAR